jgi:hypothetical protein
MFRSISVLLNEPEARGSALSHASEWASRLRLPLRGLEWPMPALNSREGALQLFRPFELCVLENELPSAFKEMLFSRVLRSTQTSAMICPRTWRPVSRVLIVNQHPRPGDGFLDATAGICRAFEVTPILLTVARTEAEARTRERSTEEAFARRRLTVDCDIVTECDVTTAVVRAMRWRRCSHVLVEHRCTPRWRRWLEGDLVRDLAALPDSPALLALHETTALPSGESSDVGRAASEVGRQA